MTDLPMCIPFVSIDQKIEHYYSIAEEAITVFLRLHISPEIRARNPDHRGVYHALHIDACEAYELWQAALEGQQAGWKFLCAEMRHDGVEIDVLAPADPERFRRWGLPALADFVEEWNREGRYVTTGFRLPWLYDHRPRSERPSEPGP
jgi:hypothetical protein